MKKRISTSVSEVEEDFKGDVWGQVLTTQQRLEALSARIGAVERRLSAELGEGENALYASSNFTGGELVELTERISQLENPANGAAVKNEIKNLKNELEDLAVQCRGEGTHTPSPVFQWATYRVQEISGVVVGVTAIIAAVLLATDNIDVLKNPMFPLVMGVALITVAISSRLRRKKEDDLDVIYIP
jgi:hypothetical protein